VKKQRRNFRSYDDAPRYEKKSSISDDRDFSKKRYERYDNAPRFTNIAPITPGQKKLAEAIRDNTIIFCNGYPGTGKTLLSLYYGMRCLDSNQYEHLTYIRSDVGMEGQRSRGALPGGLYEKFLSLRKPLEYNLSVFCKTGLDDYLMKNKIELLFLEDVRGASLSNRWIIVDESQNLTSEQFYTVLTRLGDNSKMILIGDTLQKDTSSKWGNGLKDAFLRYAGIPSIGLVEMGRGDIVRSQIIKEIIIRWLDNNPQDAYDSIL
jgi:phosphate starvation-inducible PhoH-like protein